MYGWLFGRRKPARNVEITMPGDGDEFDIVGESHYQRHLDRICGGKTDDGHDLDCTAYLVPEPSNRYDKNAVRVVIERETVGYLTRDNALRYHECLEALGHPGAVVKCEARIVGGWRRGRKESGQYGVKLDFSMDRLR